MKPPKRTVLWAFWEGKTMLLSEARRRGMDWEYFWVDYDRIERSHEWEYQRQCREYEKRVKLKALDHQIQLSSPIDYP